MRTLAGRARWGIQQFGLRLGERGGLHFDFRTFNPNAEVPLDLFEHHFARVPGQFGDPGEARQDIDVGPGQRQPGLLFPAHRADVKP